MNTRFNADEVLKMAEEIERNGARFYQRAGEGMEGSRGRKLLLDLAAMEKEHERFFAAMREGLSNQERERTVFDPDHQSSSYLKAWADGHVFDLRKDPVEGLSGETELENILQMAIGLEKDSIVFYLGMKYVTPERMGRARIEEIIQEEMNHIGFLTRELAIQRHSRVT